MRLDERKARCLAKSRIRNLLKSRFSAQLQILGAVPPDMLPGARKMAAFLMCADSRPWLHLLVKKLGRTTNKRADWSKSDGGHDAETGMKCRFCTLRRKPRLPRTPV
jgi:hypothetical protein